MLRVVGQLFAAWTYGPESGSFAEATTPPVAEIPAGKLTMSLFGHFLTPATPVSEAAAVPAVEIASVVATSAAAPQAAPVRNPSMLAARLRCTANLNRNSARLSTGRKAKVTRPAPKRAAQLYPVKLKKITAKRARTKIIVTRPKLKSAIILRFPARVAKAALQRHRPAA